MNVLHDKTLLHDWNYLPYYCGYINTNRLRVPNEAGVQVQTKLLEVVMNQFLRRLVILPVAALLLIGCTEGQNPVEPGSSSTDLSAPSLSKLPSTPPTNSGTIVDVAVSNPDFSILVQAVQFADLAGTLSNPKARYTVFAPTNEAFVRLLGRLGLTPEQLFVPENKELVKSILLYHVASGVRTSKVVLKMPLIFTLKKEFIIVKGRTAEVGNFKNGFASIIATDVRASNGIIHVIDDVMVQRSVPVPPIQK